MVLFKKIIYCLGEGEGSTVCIYTVCIWGHQFVPPPKKKSSGANDVITMFVHVPSFQCYAILRTFEFRRGSLLRPVVDRLTIYVLRFIISEVKMTFTCSPKAKTIQSNVCKQNNCPRFGDKVLRIPT